MTTNTHNCRGTKIRTQAGKWFDFMNPKPSDIHLRDIAFNLANTNRYNGACGTYSVAEHCIVGYEFAKRDEAIARAWMLHDASEAYLGDMVRPVKNMCESFRAIENKLQGIINERFGVPETFKATVKVIDNTVSDIEEQELWTRAPKKPRIKFLHPTEAYKQFLAICLEVDLV